MTEPTAKSKKSRDTVKMYFTQYLLLVPFVRAAMSYQPEYANYTQMDVKDHILSGSLTIVTLFKQVSDLIPSVGPLSQVLGLTKELIDVINQIRGNRDGCEFLVERILRFMKKLIEECARINEPIRDGTPMASRLHDLISWVSIPQIFVLSTLSALQEYPNHQG